MLADDIPQKEIAFKLGISYQTVKNHIYGNGGNIGVTTRLGKASVIAAVVEAVRRGLIA